jgi:hypothetical protein
VIPVAAEAMWAVFGGLIPILGALAIFFIIFQAVRDSPEDDEEDDSAT